MGRVRRSEVTLKREILRAPTLVLVDDWERAEMRWRKHDQSGSELSRVQKQGVFVS